MMQDGDSLPSLVAAAVADAPLGVALLSPDGRFLWVNDWLARVAGIESGGVAGRRTAELFGNQDAGLAERFIHVLTTGQTVSGLELHVNIQGERRMGSGTFVPVKDRDGKVVAIATIWWGIEDPEPAAQARAELQARFEMLADAAPVLIWMADTSGVADWFNAGWLAFTGMSMEEAIGGGGRTALHPDDLPRIEAVYQAAFAARTRYEVEYRLRRSDGAYRWVVDWAVPRFTPDGTFAGFIGSIADIDDRRAAEAAEREARRAAEETATRLARLQSVTAAFAETHTPEGVFEVVIAEVVAASGAAAGTVCILRDDGTTVEVVRAVGYRDEFLQQFRRFPIDADLPIAGTIRTMGAAYLDSPAPSGYAATATLPLVVWGRTTGALGLSFADPQPFDADQRAFLDALARQCATALERARLFESESAARRAAEAAHVRLMFLAEASEVIASTLDRTEVLTRVADLAVSRLADSAAAYLPEGGALARVALAPDDAAAPPVLSAETVELDADTPVATAYCEGPTTGDGVVAVPITARGRILGVLAFARTENTETTEDDLAVAVELGARVGVALENAGLYEREHTLAESLQRAVLPARLPKVEGIELAATYLPAGPGVEVGGDWYDAFLLRDGRLGIAIGDVAGHGVLAAATMGQLRNALRAYAVDGDDPATVLERLSALLLDEGEEAFATGIYAVVDLDTGCVRWANAGHPPAFHVGARCRALLAEPVGTVLGFTPTQYDHGELTLEPGEALLLYTDGLIERRGEHLSDGTARLAAALDEVRSRPIDTVCDDVVDRVLGALSRDDDVCLLVVRRSPVPVH